MMVYLCKPKIYSTRATPLSVFSLSNKLNRLQQNHHQCLSVPRSSKMDSQSFREFGKAAVDFIADYIENIADR